MDGRESRERATARLFIALWPDPGTRRRLAQERDRWRWSASAAVVPVERLHATLHFLGAVGRDRLPEVADRLGAAGEPFALTFGKHALWTGGIAVLEPLATPPRLLALHAALGAAIVDLALPVERRRYRPHVTLARHAEGSTAPADPAPFAWALESHALIESIHGGYEPLRFYRSR